MKKKAKKDNSLFSYYGFTKRDAKKYPVISGILKQLTPERIKKEIQEIQKVELPPELQKWVREYEKVGERNSFLWKWIYRIIPVVTFFHIPTKYQKLLARTKFFTLMIFAVLLNDTADKLKNKNLLDAISKTLSGESLVNLNNFDSKEKEYISFVKKLWNYTLSMIKKVPRYKEFEDVLSFDIDQLLNATEYDYLLGRYYQIVNKTENWLYSPHTMVAMVLGDVDIMCITKFSSKEIGKIREIFWQAQKMARIGNWITSWERELLDNDFTSGIFVYALDSGILNIDNLEDLNKIEISKKIKKSSLEKELLKEWESCYNKVKNLSIKVKSLNTASIAPKLEKLLFLELSTQKCM